MSNVKQNVKSYEPESNELNISKTILSKSSIDILNKIENNEFINYINSIRHEKKGKKIALNDPEQDKRRFDYVDTFNLNILDQILSTLDYQFFDSWDFVYLLKKQVKRLPSDNLIEDLVQINEEKIDNIDPITAREFISNFIRQRDLNTYFKNILNEIWQNGVLHEFYLSDAENQEKKDKIYKIQTEKMFKIGQIDDEHTKRYKLFNFQIELFSNHHMKPLHNQFTSKSDLNIEQVRTGAPINKNSIKVSNMKYYQDQLYAIIAQFEELIKHKISICGNPLRYSKSTTFSGGNKAYKDIFEQQEITYMAKSDSFYEFLFAANKAQQIQIDKGNRIKGPVVIKKDMIQNLFIEVLDQWLDFEISESIDPKEFLHFENAAPNSPTVIPLFSKIEEKQITHYCKKYNINLKVNDETCNRQLVNSFNKKYETDDYIWIEWNKKQAKHYEDTRVPLQANPNAMKISEFVVNGANILDYAQYWNNQKLDEIDLEQFPPHQVSQNKRQYLQNRIISDQFNLSELSKPKIDILQSQFPLHYIPEQKVLQRRYSSLFDIGSSVFHNLSEQEIDDLKDYFGSYVAIQFNFIDVILDNFKRWANPMSIVALIWLVTQILIIFDFETEISFQLNAMVQLSSQVIVIFQSVFTQTDQKVRQQKLNIKWGLSSTNLQNVLLERVEFKGVQKENLINGFLDNELDYNYIQQVKLCGSQVILLVCVIIVTILTQQLGVFKAQLLTQINNQLDPAFKQLTSFIIGFILGSQIKIANIFQGKLAHMTTLWENPKQVSEFETSKFIKVFIFRCVNAYLTLFKITVLNQINEKCTLVDADLSLGDENYNQVQSDCWQDASITLFMIFITLLIQNQVDQQACHGENSALFAENEYSTIDDQVEQESRDSMGKDYLDLVIENGFVMLFGATNPVVFLLLLYNLQVMMNTDLIHLLTITRRPIPRMANSIGIFEQFYIFLMILSLITNGLQLAFNSKVVVATISLINPNFLSNMDKIKELSFFTFYGMHYIAGIWLFVCQQQQVNYQNETKLHTERNQYISKTLQTQFNEL